MGRKGDCSLRVEEMGLGRLFGEEGKRIVGIKKCKTDGKRSIVGVLKRVKEIGSGS